MTVRSQSQLFLGDDGLLVTWNPAYKNPSIVLSGGNLIAGHAGGSNWGIVLATVGRDPAVSNHYFEVVGSAATIFSLTGFGTGTTSTASGHNLSTDLDSCGWYAGGGFYYATTNFYAAPTWSAGGDVLGFLVKNNKLYIRKNSATWENSGDPIAQTGYIFDFSAHSLLAPPMYPACAIYEDTQTITGRFESSAFTLGALPAGSKPWNIN